MQEILEKLSRGNRPSPEDLQRAVMPRSLSRAHGQRGYQYDSELVRLLLPFISLEQVAQFYVSVENISGGIEVGLVDGIYGQSDVADLLSQADVAPVHFEYSEAPCCLVGLSAIHGEGLFAGRDFSEGEVVADYSLSFQKWTQVPYKAVVKIPQVWDLLWFVGETSEVARVASKNSVFMRANHSHKPSTLWNPVAKTLSAIKKLPHGEEVTYDYHREITPAWLSDFQPAWIASDDGVGHKR